MTFRNEGTIRATLQKKKDKLQIMQTMFADKPFDPIDTIDIYLKEIKLMKTEEIQRHLESKEPIGNDDGVKRAIALRKELQKKPNAFQRCQYVAQELNATWLLLFNKIGGEKLRERLSEALSKYFDSKFGIEKDAQSITSSKTVKGSSGPVPVKLNLTDTRVTLLGDLFANLDQQVEMRTISQPQQQIRDEKRATP